jgi:hypothetical protein
VVEPGYITKRFPLREGAPLRRRLVLVGDDAGWRVRSSTRSCALSRRRHPGTRDAGAVGDPRRLLATRADQIDGIFTFWE